jgi:hypothetical protein
VVVNRSMTRAGGLGSVVINAILIVRGLEGSNLLLGGLCSTVPGFVQVGNGAT